MGTRPKPVSFRTKIGRAFQRNSSRIVLAIDIHDSGAEAGLRKAKSLLKTTSPYLCGVKLGRQTVLNLGTDGTRKITRIVHDSQLPCIIDDKANDIGATNVEIARAYFRLGFDAMTANPFVGWKGGMQPLFEAAHNNGKGILLLVYMSHPGAQEGYGQKVINGTSRRYQYSVFARKALNWKSDGVVIGATWPKIVREIKEIVGSRIPIFSPGVGTQGGSLTQAQAAGTDYFIIGRSITRSSDPERSAMKFAQESTRQN